MFKDFYEAYEYLRNHDMFQEKIEFGGGYCKILDTHLQSNTWYESRFAQCLDIDVVKVNPLNNTIEDDQNLNTKTQIWLECGKYNPDYGCHDIELDCGGDTFEEAIIELAKLVKLNYGKGDINEG